VIFKNFDDFIQFMFGEAPISGKPDRVQPEFGFYVFPP